MLLFQSTPPARGATSNIGIGSIAYPNFNPRPPRGGRLRLPPGRLQHLRISIHAPREGGDDEAVRMAKAAGYISIHAPREGGDHLRYIGRLEYNGISIHAPREGGDRGGGHDFLKIVLFQSTPPARGATRRASWPPRAWRISIHAPREGGDCRYTMKGNEKRRFQSTPPARGATTDVLQLRFKIPYFNPRPPRGGRPQGSCSLVAVYVFQSTPPARGATPRRARPCRLRSISIHAPREGGDR